MRAPALLVCSSLAFAPLVRAAPPPPPPSPTAPAPGRVDVKRATLDNGLRVVVLVDHGSPTVAIDVVYDVGARDEERGRTGFAHLVERMMLQGSKNVPRGEHARLVTGRGGRLGAATDADQTSYFELLPSSELAFGLWLEADRMKSLDVSPMSFDIERADARRELRARVESAAYAAGSIRLRGLVFHGYWPYEHPLTGTSRDIDAARVDGIRAFHEAYYAPNNAVVAIAGDLDQADAFVLATRYFGDARRGADVPRHAPPPLPAQTAPRSAVVEDAHARLPALLMGWALPASHEADHAALALAARLLGDGESSRLRRTLVRERPLAVEARAWTHNHRGPDMLEIDVELASGARVGDVAALVDAQIAELARVGPTDDEMKKLASRARTRAVVDLQSNIARARRLAATELRRGDATLLDAELETELAVGKDDIRRAVANYLTPARRCSVEVKPGERK